MVPRRLMLLLPFHRHFTVISDVQAVIITHAHRPVIRHLQRLVITYRDAPVVRHRDTLVVAPFFSGPDLNRLPLHHRYLLVVPDGLRMVMFHIRRPVVKYLRVHVLLRVDIDLFLIRRILKAQLIKTASFIGLRPYRHLRLRSRQVPRRTVVLMVRPAHDQRLVRVPVQKINNHLLAHPRYRQITKSRPRPRLRHTHPARTLLRHPVITVPVKLHPYPAMFITEDFLSRRPGDNGALWPVHLRFALQPWTPRPVRRYHL
ncbi:hypothetical protein HmCmsJML143_04674 [Escherichia coli]|nr:hypothetical protein HmCmsJML143_04674 [Escherichia coli]SPW48508.1 Uncharacterised protein [Escherichia coli]